MVLPSGFEHFFEEMAAMQANGVEIMEALKMAGEKYGTTFFPPE
jgi:type II secretory pathway component PulF